MLFRKRNRNFALEFLRLQMAVVFVLRVVISAVSAWQTLLLLAGPEAAPTITLYWLLPRKVYCQTPQIRPIFHLRHHRKHLGPSQKTKQVIFTCSFCISFYFEVTSKSRGNKSFLTRIQPHVSLNKLPPLGKKIVLQFFWVSGKPEVSAELFIYKQILEPKGKSNT